jgi:hypothetical protein
MRPVHHTPELLSVRFRTQLAQASWGSVALKQSLTVNSIEVKNMAATSKARGIMMDKVA